MLVCRWRPLLRVVPSLGLLLSLIGGTVAAQAQEVVSAPDGQVFLKQSRVTQDAFTAIFGSACAEREWIWQHSLAIDSDFVDGPPASDGQKLTDQDDDVQLAFVALFGPQANTAWVAEHNAVVAHRVLATTPVSVPCPPTKDLAPTNAIGTTHLADAVAAAKRGDFANAYIGFDAFRVIWAAARARVGTQSPSAAAAVQNALDEVNPLMADRNNPPPQGQYYPALQNLLKAVRDANATLGT
ncbi:MAG TPA: hypothetical protein VF937_07325 [Chloroflexota bacterium]